MDATTAFTDKRARKSTAIKWSLIVQWILLVCLATPLAVMIGLAPVVGQPLYNSMLFHPQKYQAGDYANPTLNGTTPIDVQFKSDSGARLQGFLYRLPDAKRIILLSHGNGGDVRDIKRLAAMLLRTGNSVFAYDYEGYGLSEGEPSLEGICRDGSAAYQYLITQEHYAPNQIILFGESLGTLVTGKLAGSVNCAGVILECPLYSIHRIGCDVVSYLDNYPDWAWTAEARQLDNSVSLKKSHAPLLLIAGTADQITPVTYADDLYALAPSPKQFIRIDGAGHGDRLMRTSPDYKRGLEQFLKDLDRRS